MPAVLALAALLASVALPVHATTAHPLATEAPGGWPAAPTSSYDADLMPCADVLFLGARGSGQLGSYGPEVEAVRDGVRDGYGRLPGIGDQRTVREVYVDYPAAAMEVLYSDLGRLFDTLVFGLPWDGYRALYLESIDNGAAKVRAVLDDSLARCPNEKWVLAGYSQGALAISLALPDYPYYSRFGGVMLVGNPANSPDLGDHELGTSQADSWGLGAPRWGTELPPALRGLIHSECSFQDLVCDTSTLIAAVTELRMTLGEAQAIGGSVHTSYPAWLLAYDAQPIVAQLLGIPVPIEDEYEQWVPADEDFSGRVAIKPLSSQLNPTWEVVLGTAAPAGWVDGGGLTVASDGSYLGHVPAGRYTVQLRVTGEFPDHARTVLLAVVAGGEPPPSAAVEFPSVELKRCVAEALGRTWLEDITRADMASLRVLSCPSRAIDDITPLVYATGLTTLDLGANPLSGVTPLANLTGLTDLRLGGTPLSNVAPLARLSGLVRLSLGSTSVQDVSALDRLDSLEWLNLSNTGLRAAPDTSMLGALTTLGLASNFITDLHALSSSPTLTSLDLHDNWIAELAPLATLTRLDGLWLSENSVADVGPLAGLVGLRDLSLTHNRITDVSSIGTLTHLRSLELGYNTVSDIGPLSSLTNLDSLGIEGNDLEDVSALASMSMLRSLRASNNHITDVRPLSQLQLYNLLLDENAIIDVSPLYGDPQWTTLGGETTFERQVATLAPVTTCIPFALPFKTPVTEWPFFPDGDPLTVSASSGGRLMDGFVTWTTPGTKSLTFGSTGRIPFNGVATQVVTQTSTECLTETPVPTVSGAQVVGNLLTVDPGAWAPENVELTYQWRRSGSSIPGATGASYLTTPADVGASVTVAVTGSKPGYTTVTMVSVPLVVEDQLVGPVPAISGTPGPGSVLTAVPGVWPNPADTFLSFQWRRTGVAIPGAVGSTYTVTGQDIGRPLTVSVTGARTGYGSATLTSSPLIVEGPPFADVTTQYPFTAEIAWLAQRGISTGWVMADGTAEFRPLESVSREAMAAFLYRAAGSPPYTPPTASAFTDVPTTHPFYAQISWLADQRISTGWVMADGTAEFRPLESVSREAMAAFLYRAAGSPPYTPPTVAAFTDVPTTYPFYAQVSWLADQGISRGWVMGDGSKQFRPTTAVTREAMAAFLRRADGLLNP